MTNQSSPTHATADVRWAVLAAFGCYFCMHGFRKAFAVATFEGSDVGNLNFKTLLVVSQVAGYMVSKFIGVKLIAEMPASRRPAMLAMMILFAELALVLFGLIPRPWNAIAMFLNGMPLGMIFGLILGQLEGRRMTEALTAGLCTSFVLADGFSKTVGGWVLTWNVSEDWMPAATGVLFVVPQAICIWMLAQIHPPSQDDVDHRSERVTLGRQERMALLKQFAGGLFPLAIMYLMVTILRSMRADFQKELWQGLGVESPPAIFTYSETWVAFFVLAINGSAVLVRNNVHAFNLSLATCGGGIAMAFASLIARQQEIISPFVFMVLIGLSLYLPYVAVHTTVFERLLAMTRVPGNSGFFLYVVDSVGYLGYVSILLLKSFGGNAVRELRVIDYFLTMCWLCCSVALICVALSWIYFARHRKQVSH